MPLDPTDLIDTNPLLGPLAANGGLTHTMALLPGSPAARRRDRCLRCDHRSAGLPRTGTATDIGAFEGQSVPTVITLKRYGVHYQPTFLVLTFSQPISAAPADNRANYRLVLLRPDQRPATKHDRIIPIRSASYDAGSDTVTLQPIYYRLPLRRTYELTVVATPPGGLTDANGVYLYGSGASQPGSNIVLTFNSKALALEPSRHRTPK